MKEAGLIDVGFVVETLRSRESLPSWRLFVLDVDLAAEWSPMIVQMMVLQEEEYRLLHG